METLVLNVAVRILAICGLGGFLRLLVGKDGAQVAHGL